jgi:hypothetical protein
VGDTFWMEDEVRVEWAETDCDFGMIFKEPAKPILNTKVSFRDTDSQEFKLEEARYPVSDTGSQYLDPDWRRKLGKIKPKLTKIEVLISLN